MSVETAKDVSLKDDSRISYQNTNFENDDIVIKTKSNKPTELDVNGGTFLVPIS